MYFFACHAENSFDTHDISSTSPDQSFRVVIFISFVLFGKQTHTKKKQKKQQKTTDKINKQTHE